MALLVTPNASPFGYTLTAPVTVGIYAGGTLKVNIALNTATTMIASGDCSILSYGIAFVSKANRTMKLASPP